MKIIIPGGSGQIGTMLAHTFHDKGHEVVVLSRTPQTAPYRMMAWDAQTVEAWAEEFEGADVVINLAGRSVNCRYNAQNRQAMLESRVQSTKTVGEAIAHCKQPPHLWLQSSTATIYAHRYDAPNDEVSGILGGTEANVPDTWRFSIDVARAWEQAVEGASTPHTRKVKMRAAMVMSPNRDGVFDVLLGLVRRGLGGRAGDGRQFVSWIHYQDFIRAIDWIIEHESLAGPINLAAPEPLPNAEFMRALRDAWGIRVGLPATELMLKIGTFVMRTETELVLKSRRVVPGRLLQDGFEFRFPSWPQAAQDLCRGWRNRQQRNDNDS